MLASASAAMALVVALSNNTTRVAAAPQEDADGPKVAVLPLVVKGTLPDAWREQANSRVRSGLSRANMRVQELVGSTCAAVDCAGGQASSAGAAYGIWSQLTVRNNQRDYAFVIKAVGANSSTVLATVEGTCELCGLEEGIAMVEAKAASLPAAIERLSATHPVVAFTSTPPGVDIELDGEHAGTTPLELPLSPGKHRVRGAKEGYQPQTFEVEAVEGVRKELTFGLVEVAVADPTLAVAEEVPAPASKRRTIAGAILVPTGALAVGGGAALVVLHGRSYGRNDPGRCDADAAGNCRALFDTKVYGALAVGAGAAAIGAGVALLVLAKSRAKTKTKAADVAARFRPRLGGIAVRF